MCCEIFASKSLLLGSAFFLMDEISFFSANIQLHYKTEIGPDIYLT
jgi:hypothetical protein